MKLSDTGEIARSSLIEIPQYFQNSVLDEFIVMPNHIHLLLGICECRDAINRVSTDGEDNHVLTGGGITGTNNPMLQDNSVSKIIRWYKGRTSFFIRKTFSNQFAWQSRFYDRIIRDETELNNARDYIANNPLQWEFDKCNPNL